MGVAFVVAEELVCPGVGRFPDPSSCGAYFDCTPNAADGYDLTKDDCRGYTYSTATRTCTDELCNSRSKRSVTPDNHLHSRLCESRPDGFQCANCKTLLVCVKGQAFTRHCREDHFCSERNQFGGAVCYPGEPVACTCVKANTFRKDLYDPQEFFACSDVGAKPKAYKCPDGMTFDESSKLCRNIGGFPSCTAPGSFVNPSNCSEYYSCIAVKHGWLQSSFKCSAGTFFNDVTEMCEDPCKYQFVCQQEGRYPDPLMKGSYFECYLLGGVLKQMRYRCPGGYMWKVNFPGAGKCVEDPGYEDSGYPFHQCTIPDDLC
ncbi:uncharacterized protein LOC122268149 [Penaeus japonicus]|uniref:uncharacterized protein LOC122268149 n=1 Tax=Penaeus japonicus TaxID=27405 RepID=UPI001C716C9A|nr:uncharacterized protein LOC122268149 [Penaeus japonicus]